MDDISVGGLTILLAEDEKNDVYLFREAYSRAKLSNPLQVVRDGVEVTEYLSGKGKYADREQYAYPILLLLDWRMPRMDGIETLAWIRKEEGIKNLWVVMLTNENEQRGIDKENTLRANSFFAKPGSREGWGSLIAMIHGCWLNLAETARLHCAKDRKRRNNNAINLIDARTAQGFYTALGFGVF